MPSLLDRTRGYAAFAVRRALGRSPDAKVEALEKRVRELERTLAQQLRLYNGLTINNFSTTVGLDHKKRHHFMSRDGSIVLSKVEGYPYAVDFSVDPAELPFCENAIAGIVDCADESADVTGCGDRIELHAGTYVAAKKTTPDHAGNVAVVLHWCAPAGTPRPLVGECVFPGQFAGWLQLSLGDACEGDCEPVVIPYWTPAS